MKYFAGLDVSLRSCAICIADNKGSVLFERELACEVGDITECLAGFGRLRLRGPCGANDEFLLAATAQNLRKLAKIFPASQQTRNA